MVNYSVTVFFSWWFSSQCLKLILYIYICFCFSINITDTHKIVTKNVIKVSSPQDDPIVSCCIEKTSDNVITGCLAVIISNNTSELPIYRIIENRDHQTCVNETITGLSPHNRYSISLFEVLGYPPFPARFSAATESFMLSSMSNTHHVSMPQGKP